MEYASLKYFKKKRVKENKCSTIALYGFKWIHNLETDTGKAKLGADDLQRKDRKGTDKQQAMRVIYTNERQV